MQTDWKLLHPKMTMEHLGLLPIIITSADPRPAKDQINERYAHGGGWSPLPKWRIDIETLNAKYPGDPVYKPLAKLELPKETVAFYDHSWVAIIQLDGSYEMSRMD
jgi:hypothetical protein